MPIRPQRSISFISATTLVAASMIGVGVYTTSGFTLDALGSPWLVIAAWFVAGLIAICGATGYATLAKRYTESGGEYLFLSRSLHPVAGLMAGWVSLLAGFTGAMAVAAIGLETYLQPIIESWVGTVPPRTIAITVILAAALIHSIGVRQAARIQDAIVAIKLLMLGVIMFVAFRALGRWEGLESSGFPLSAGQNSRALEFANQLVWISFSYSGFNAAIYVASEVKSARRNVPKAVVMGTVAVTVIYVILNAIFVLAPPASVVTDPERIGEVATNAAQTIGGNSFSLLVRWVIVISLGSSVFALMMSGPRVYAMMADDGFLPGWFRYDEKLPIPVIWFQAAAGIVAVSVTSLQSLLGCLGLTLSVSAALSVSMVFVLRSRDEISKLWLSGVPAGIYIIATLVLAALYGYAEPVEAAVAGGIFITGLVLYFAIDKSPTAKPNR